MKAILDPDTRLPIVCADEYPDAIDWALFEGVPVLMLDGAMFVSGCAVKAVRPDLKFDVGVAECAARRISK